MLGAIWLARRDPAAAEAAYARALAQRPDLPEAHAGRGLALLALGRAEDGAAELARAQASGGDTAALQLAQGDAARVLGRPDEARLHYRSARERAEAQGDVRLAAEAAQRLEEMD